MLAQQNRNGRVVLKDTEGKTTPISDGFHMFVELPNIDIPNKTCGEVDGLPVYKNGMWPLSYRVEIKMSQATDLDAVEKLLYQSNAAVHSPS